MTNSRATYGYRRVWAMVNRTYRVGYNRKRIRRVMQLHGLGWLSGRGSRMGWVQSPAWTVRLDFAGDHDLQALLALAEFLFVAL